MTNLDNIFIQKLIKELELLNFKLVNDPDNCNNICFKNEENDIWRCSKEMFFRINGMCMTHGFVSKDKRSNSVIIKWIPITDEMFYNIIKVLILNKLQ